MQFSLPRIGSRDLVNEIEKKRRVAKYRREWLKNNKKSRCLGTNSCDCSKCR